MAISVIPDLDLNGYNDVVVGAPLEDKQKGVIYIYNGFSNGLNKEFSQVQHIKSKVFIHIFRGEVICYSDKPH